jgi:hypothetical protein
VTLTLTPTPTHPPHPTNTQGVSENIILGNLVPVGTGAFDLLVDEAAVAGAQEVVFVDAAGERAGPLGGWTVYFGFASSLVFDSPELDTAHAGGWLVGWLLVYFDIGWTVYWLDGVFWHLPLSLIPSSWTPPTHPPTTNHPPPTSTKQPNQAASSARARRRG